MQSDLPTNTLDLRHSLAGRSSFGETKPISAPPGPLEPSHPVIPNEPNPKNGQWRASRGCCRGGCSQSPGSDTIDPLEGLKRIHATPHLYSVPALTEMATTNSERAGQISTSFSFRINYLPGISCPMRLLL